MAGKRRTLKKINTLAPGEERRFDGESKTVSIASQAGGEWEFQGIVAILKDENGTVYMEKTNGSLVEIASGYVFLEVGDTEESEEIPF